MPYRIFITYPFHASDLCYLSGAEHIEIIDGSKWRTEPLDALYLKAKQADLLVFKAHGLDINSFLQRCAHHRPMLDLMKSDKLKVSWSEDSHHLWEAELLHLEYFNTHYVAHSEYLSKFPAGKAVWLPCCFHWYSIDKVLQILRATPEREENDLIYYFVNYKIGDRNRLANIIRNACDAYGLQTLFGRVAGGWDQTLEQIRRTKVVLNISLLGELNQRNFQALVFNKPLLCDRTPDHEKLSINWDSTKFFSRDLSDFGTALGLALRVQKPIRTAPSVLNGHMLTHRFVELFNRELGLRMKMALVEDSCN